MIFYKKFPYSLKFLLLLVNIVFMSNTNELKKITIFVHGTHTALLTTLLPKTLYIPWKLEKINDLNEHNYIKWLCEKVSHSDSDEYPLNSFYALGWSGILSHKARLIAAKNLSNEINKLVLLHENKDYQITIIGQSHGCNVALNLAYYLPKSIKIKKLILLACPVQDLTKDLINNIIFEKIYSIYSNWDLLQVFDPQKLQNSNATNFFSMRRFDHNNKLKQAKIEINGRGILHIEYIFWNFAKILSSIIKEMDKLPNDHLEHTIKVLYKNHQIKNIEID